MGICNLDRWSKLNKPRLKKLTVCVESNVDAESLLPNAVETSRAVGEASRVVEETSRAVEELSSAVEETSSAVEESSRGVIDISRTEELSRVAEAS